MKVELRKPSLLLR